MKKQYLFLTLLMSLTFLITGCNETEAERQARLDRQAHQTAILQAKRDVRFAAIQDCAVNPAFTIQSCTQAYDYANTQTRPHISSLAQCEMEFGYGACRNQGGYFAPMVTGYLLGSMMSSGPDYRTQHTTVFVSSNPKSTYYNQQRSTQMTTYRKSYPTVTSAKTKPRTALDTKRQAAKAVVKTKEKPKSSSASVAALRTGSTKSAAAKTQAAKKSSWAATSSKRPDTERKTTNTWASSSKSKSRSTSWGTSSSSSSKSRKSSSKKRR